MSDASSPRVAPLPREQWGDDEREALRRFLGDAADRVLAPDTGPPPAVIATLLRHPRLAGPWLAYNNVLLSTPSIDARVRELMILRVAWRTGSRYEWVQHVRLARRLGVTDAEIAAVAGEAEPGWTPLEADLLAATDELLDGYEVADDTWARLATHLDERQLMEAVFVVGTYACLAMALRTFGVELDPDLVDYAVPAMPDPWTPDAGARS
jgi:AhpD family alkylhydroperoxidase